MTVWSVAEKQPHRHGRKSVRVVEVVHSAASCADAFALMVRLESASGQVLSTQLRADGALLTPLNAEAWAEYQAACAA
jgi:hypothetical protein